MLASTLSNTSWLEQPAMLRSLYNASLPERVSKGRKPLIALTAHHTEQGHSLNEAYTEAIEAAGGVALIIPTAHRYDHISSLLDAIDGLLLTGGGDLLSPFMGAELTPEVGSIDIWRDRLELLLVLEATRRNLPILGICRGLQLYNIAFGGTLLQDIQKEGSPNALNHSPQIDKTVGCHAIRLASGDNPLATLLGVSAGDRVWVNSLHHQALGRLASGLRPLAFAPDGIVEAATALPEKNFIGVQWHPEHLVKSPEGKPMQRLFEYLVKEATLYAQSRAIHAQSILLDSHTDTPITFTEGTDLARWSTELVDLCKMQYGQVSATVMAAYIPQGACTPEGHRKAQQYALEKLDAIHYHVAQHPSYAGIATTAREVRALHEKGLLSILPAIENGYAMGSDLSLLRTFRDKGVVYITLCHNGDNALCDAANKSLRTHGGLSALGKEVVQQLNQLGILIDISHASDETIEQVLALSQYPIIASHSSCRALCQHPRNLSDSHIRAIAQKGGVVQVCLYHNFIDKVQERATVQRAVDHIDHIVSLAGVEAVGIGSDFDGGGELIGCRGSHDLRNITLEMLRRGYSSSDLSAILGGNFLRVMEASGH